ncbi:sugar phosphate isomerase/epimerase family protein [Salipiger mangrovisoli]|uniref:Sugar phosphate isomerase/epimerase n=1 Tax=Salipiger mangrovisoli TaxID=2865933 RepID=A0ABR9X1E5_9RHOB|nr:sugar phosphate isomerase/epimerase family protein [Salipiger mangrovisoli]MBE9637341.1 sugar phosphate isomerase/epimerase [Salipiger mangrovisoli]
MQFGVSSYSFQPLLRRQEITLEGVFEQIAASGGTHMELATLTIGHDLEAMMDYELYEDAGTRGRLEAAAANTGIVLSGLCIPASFIGEETGTRRAQIDRAKRYVDLCADMGVGFLRTDVVPWALRPESYAQVEALFPVITEACIELADHAAARGVVTSIENHGFLMNSSERCRRLVHAVDSPNFRMTLDVGNFLCVDEDPLMATQSCLDIASFVHVKDFLRRKRYPGPGWLETLGGRHIVGTVFGFGDLDTHALVRAILRSGYDGYVSLEFEGNEPTLMGCDTGLANVIRIFSEVKAELAA